MPGLKQTELEGRIEREFLAMPLRPSTMTFYPVRTAILRSVKAETAAFYGEVLDVGCGFMPYRAIVESVEAVTGYTGMDLERPVGYSEAKPEIKWDGRSIPAEDERFDCVMATEFLEHIAVPQSVLSEVYRVMRPGGLFFATMPFVWNLHEVPHDEYRYTPYSIERIVSEAGFADIQVKPLAGWNASLAQMIGLWLGFAPMRNSTRRLLRSMIFPFYKALLQTDRVFDGFDGLERSMFTGLSVTARKPEQPASE